MRPLSSLLTLLCALSLGTVAAADIAQAGKPAPQFSAPLSTGGTFNLAALHGKAVYLNFFANWCPPCNEEAPDVNALQKQYRKRGFVVIGVDERESASRANDFIHKYGLTYKAVVDDSGSILAPYGAIGLPVHVFIDRKGKIKLVRNGELSKADMEKAIKSIL
ncbi:MAG: TlpA family protein disulfide reductase [Candidatus Eremiobacteraeota bacterium]|nr:TlpA family protein disulfide reductase [Candidatus Eremiobacteraeota bacterium]